MRSSDEALTDALQSWPGVRLAVLFGSAARGEAAPPRSPMVRAEVAAARVARAQAWLAEAESLFALPPEEFVADRRGRG